MTGYFDAHNDTLTKAINAKNPVAYIISGSGDVSLEQLDQIKATGACFAAFTDGSLSPDASHQKIIKMAEVLQAAQKAYPNPPQMILTLEGGYSFTRDNWQERLRYYADLGVRMIAPVWNHSNDLGEGLLGHNAFGTISPPGLTDLGKSFLQMLSKYKILVDVSHMSPKSFWDTVELAPGPLIASHSAAMSLKSHPRNLTDAQIDAIVKSGGMVNVVFCRSFIGCPETASSTTVASHMHYLASRWGYRFVGIGSDFDGATMPTDLTKMSELTRLDDALKQFGYTTNERRMMLGGNLEKKLILQKNI